MKSILGAAVLLLAAPALAHAGHVSEAASGERVGTEYVVMETSATGEARTQFLRGLALLHNFEYDRAAEAFRQSQAADPDFVMPYWGEAMTRNYSLWDYQDRDGALAVLAKLGATPAARAAKARNAREAQWLDAVETLYGEGTKEARDLAYLAKMEAMLEQDPADIEARAFTGLAILASSHGGRQIPIFMRAAGILEEGFMEHQRHPGVLHYLIHSYDDADHAPLGARAAARYAVVAPDAGHAQHMVSHIFHALGDWQASERANINADAVVDRQRAEAGRGPTFCGHYNEWLVYALLQQGKDASEIIHGCRAQAEAQIAAGAKNRLGSGPASSYSGIALWNGVATGNWAPPLEGLGEGFLLARYDMANARLLANIGNEAEAKAAQAEMMALAAEIAAALKAEDPLNSWIPPWIVRQLAQAEAVVALSSGRQDEGLALLRAAAEAESAVPAVYGPPPMAKPSWELLGEQLLALGRKQEAAEAFGRALAFAPGRRLSQLGMEAALEP